MKYLEFETPASKQAGELASDYKLKNHGLDYLDRVFWNLPVPALVEEAIFRGEGHMVAGGPFIVNTGKWSARAAADKYIVKEPENENRIWWGEYNRPASLGTFNSILVRLQAFLQGEELFVQDCFVGADPAYRMAIRVITEKAWHSHFARNMFITTDNRDELKRHVPEFTIIALPSFKVDPRIDGTRTETAIMLNFAEKLGIIANTGYGGEIKK
ncbi:MAG TPA: phosphoenolpyruvate carboxykinase (ATP), partial [Phycisphaerae bacterium]|nr:phosphoenolpyruvate carboxykinase (ATP) [Phycisphaerae bacterium]